MWTAHSNDFLLLDIRRFNCWRSKHILVLTTQQTQLTLNYDWQITIVQTSFSPHKCRRPTLMKANGGWQERDRSINIGRWCARGRYADRSVHPKVCLGRKYKYNLKYDWGHPEQSFSWNPNTDTYTIVTIADIQTDPVQKFTRITNANSSTHINNFVQRMCICTR